MLEKKQRKKHNMQHLDTSCIECGSVLETFFRGLCVKVVAALRKCCFTRKIFLILLRWTISIVINKEHVF